MHLHCFRRCIDFRVMQQQNVPINGTSNPKSEVYIYIEKSMYVCSIFIYGHTNNTRLHAMQRASSNVRCTFQCNFVQHFSISLFAHIAKCSTRVSAHLVGSVDFPTSPKLIQKRHCDESVNIIKFSVNYIIIITSCECRNSWNNFVVVGNHYQRHQIESLHGLMYPFYKTEN